MVFLAEWFRRRIVVPVYVGSNPTEHPILRISVMVAHITLNDLVVVRIHYSQQIMGHGVMVTQEILVLLFRVRILVAQLISESSSVV